MSRGKNNKLDENEVVKALHQLVKDGKLRVGWNKQGKLVYQDTRVKPDKGVRWIEYFKN